MVIQEVLVVQEALVETWDQDPALIITEEVEGAEEGIMGLMEDLPGKWFMEIIHSNSNNSPITHINSSNKDITKINSFMVHIKIHPDDNKNT